MSKEVKKRCWQVINTILNNIILPWYGPAETEFCPFCRRDAPYEYSSMHHIEHKDDCIYHNIVQLEKDLRESQSSDAN